MSKMSELSQVLDEMIACGEGMIKAANTLKDIFSSTEEAPAKTETKTAKKVTKQEAAEPEAAKAEPAPTHNYCTSLSATYCGACSATN